jgi:hypothetical protein
MAFSRKTFKDRLLAVLSGAVTHFYMVELARRNNQTKWVQHWMNELDRLLNMDFIFMLVSEIRGRWDKRKALAETLEDLQAADRRYRTVAANYVARVYRLKKQRRDLPPELTNQFHRMVWEAAERGLADCDS